MGVKDWGFPVQALLLLLMLATALTNQWMAFGYIMALHLAMWFVIGIAKNGGLKEGLTIAIPTFVVWAGCFAAIVYFWQMFKGRFPDFTIAGMHPGLFILFPVMWLLLFVVTTLTYPLVFERWILSDEEWERFVKEAKTEVEEYE